MTQLPIANKWKEAPPEECLWVSSEAIITSTFRFVIVHRVWRNGNLFPSSPPPPTPHVNRMDSPTACRLSIPSSRRRMGGRRPVGLSSSSPWETCLQIKNPLWEASPFPSRNVGHLPWDTRREEISRGEDQEPLWPAVNGSPRDHWVAWVPLLVGAGGIRTEWTYRGLSPKRPRPSAVLGASECHLGCQSSVQWGTQQEVLVAGGWGGMCRTPDPLPLMRCREADLHFKGPPHRLPQTDRRTVAHCSTHKSNR